MLPDAPIFIVDLNEIESDGDTIHVSDEYTLQHGPGVRFIGGPRYSKGGQVRIESDEDRSLYWAEVVEVLSEGQYRVKILWDSYAPILNEIWAAECDDGVRRPAIVSASSTK